MLNHDDDCHEPVHQIDEGSPVPLAQAEHLCMVGEKLIAAVEPLPAAAKGLALLAAGLELLPAGRCTAHYRETLLEVRAEVDRLLSDIANA